MFKRMYLVLFHGITDAIRELDRADAAQARSILIRAQRDAEELYIEGTGE